MPDMKQSQGNLDGTGLIWFYKVGSVRTRKICAALIGSNVETKPLLLVYKPIGAIYILKALSEVNVFDSHQTLFI